ncbi:alpha/beta fold hydrolase [Rhodovibrionaceae bacterium A322]
MTGQGLQGDESGFWQLRSIDQADRDLSAKALTVGLAGDPAAPLLLLLPALGRTGHDFRDIAVELQAEFRLVRIDWRGSGFNAGLAPVETLETYLEDCLQVMASLSPDQPVWLLGATFGNRVARLLAARKPDRCAALILLAAGGAVPPSSEATAKAREFMAGLLSAPQSIPPELAALYFGREDHFSTQEKAEGALAEFLKGWWPGCLAAQRSAARAFVQLEQDTRTGLPPTLILQGQADQLAPPENGRKLAAELGAGARLVEIAQAGHLLALECPAQVSREILRFKPQVLPL